MPRTGFALALLVGTTVLAGCAPGVDGTATTETVTSTVTETETSTATVTATPAPVERSYDDPITAPDAWLLCWGAVFGQNSDTQTVYPYTPTAASGSSTVVDQPDGTFEVHVAFAPTDGQGFGAEATCVVGGTVGAPVIQSVGAHDWS